MDEKECDRVDVGHLCAKDVYFRSPRKMYPSGPMSGKVWLIWSKELHSGSFTGRDRVDAAVLTCQQPSLLVRFITLMW